MVDGVVMCEKDYAELVATWPCLGCGKEIPTGVFGVFVRRRRT